MKLIGKENEGNPPQTEKKKLILTDQEYCYIIHKRSGKMQLINGPARVNLHTNLFKEIYGGKRKKIILHEDQFAIILNPFDKRTKKIKYGDREVRSGPTMFPLYPGEELSTHRPIGLAPKGNRDGVNDVYVLTRKMGLHIKALKDFEKDDQERKAGEEWLMKGPATYTPHKYEKVKKIVKEITIAEHSGIYIENKDSGNVRLEKGPKTIMLTPAEVLYQKNYTESEVQAIKFGERKYCESFDRTVAQPLWILENEVAKIVSEEKQEIIVGPKVIMLKPFERPYIMKISSGTPKTKDNAIKKWKVNVAPMFVTDVLDIRTKDNAVLKIKLRYKTKFQVDDDNLEKIFAISDFIGLATETMASIIREECAKHDFEKLHSDATEIIKEVVFSENDSYVFEENGFEIFDIDIKQVIPVDEEIAEKMNDAIKSNMQIYVDKINQKAKIKAKKLQIEGEIETGEKRKELLEIENENKKAEELIKTEIETDKIRMKAEAEAEAIKIVENAKKQAKIGKIKDTIDAIGTNSTNYLKLQQIKGLSSIKKAIVPSDARMFIPQELLEDLDDHE